MGEIEPSEPKIKLIFPFGNVDMDANNQSQLERAFEMAKHMLKVHEENVATELLKEASQKTK